MEATQQAANTSKSIARDIVAKNSPQNSVDVIGLALKHYEEFSSARQLFSIGMILAFKTILDGFELNTASGHYNNLPPIQTANGIAHNPYFKFISSAIFIAYFLQLLPKRIARNKSLSFFTAIPTQIARFLNFVGSRGASTPVDIAIAIRNKLSGSPLEEVSYGVSTEKVIHELSSKFGYKVEEVNLRIFIGEKVLLHEISKIEITEAMTRKKSDRKTAVISHGIDLDGDWILFRTHADVKHSNRTTHFSRLSEQKEEIPENLHSEEDDYDEDSEEIETNEESRTKVLTEISFFGPEELPNAGSKPIFQRWLLSVDHIDNPKQSSDFEFSFGFDMPAQTLRLTIVSTRNVTPTKSELSYRNTIGEKEFTTQDFSKVALTEDDLKHGGLHAVETKISLPYYGSNIEIRTNC